MEEIVQIRSIGAALLVAAAVTVTLTGAASAGEPDRDDRADRRADDATVLILRCEDGEVVRRELTDDERERLRALPAEPLRRTAPARTARPERVEGAAPGAVRVVPAEPGERGPVECAVPTRP
jgi:hypothetical protein